MEQCWYLINTINNIKALLIWFCIKANRTSVFGSSFFVLCMSKMTTLTCLIEKTKTFYPLHVLQHSKYASLWDIHLDNLVCFLISIHHHLKSFRDVWLNITNISNSRNMSKHYKRPANFHKSNLQRAKPNLYQLNYSCSWVFFTIWKCISLNQNHGKLYLFLIRHTQIDI